MSRPIKIEHPKIQEGIRGLSLGEHFNLSENFKEENTHGKEVFLIINNNHNIATIKPEEAHALMDWLYEFIQLSIKNGYYTLEEE